MLFSFLRDTCPTTAVHPLVFAQKNKVDEKLYYLGKGLGMLNAAC